jgi:dTDP-glucose 4,6-dehydratase
MRPFQNLLVTGGAGFIGANFLRFLFEETDYSGRVVNLDALTYAGNPLSVADLAARHPDRYAFVHVDLRDAEAVRAVFARHAIDAVCHFAAESHVDRSIAGPGAFIASNVVGTYHLLEACRAHSQGLTVFHHVSTDEVFGSLGETGAFTESTPYDPRSPYSASKAASDHLVRAYHHTYGLPVTVSNCSNNYGPRQFPEKLVPLMILNALEEKPLPVYGDGRNVRDWLHVRDHAAAVWEILRRGRIGETYNIGGRAERRNLEVVEALCDTVDALRPRPDGRPRRDLITFVKDRPGHDWRYAIDCAKIERELGWRPSFTFAEGLRQTVAWYLENPAWVEAIRTGAYRDWIRAHYG